MLNDLRQDLLYGIRTLKSSPIFSFVAVFILALGIGANTTMFTIVHAVFLQDPPEIYDPTSLIGLDRLTDEGYRATSFGYPDVKYFREHNDVFTDLAAYDSEASAVAVGHDEEITQATAWAVTGSFFDVLGVRMSHGRGFSEEESRTPMTHPVVVLSHGFWQRAFGGDAAVVNRTIRLNGKPFTVIGVTPARFRGISPVETPPDLYVTVMMQGALSPGIENYLDYVNGEVMYWLRTVARLRPDVDLETAQANMDVLVSRWQQAQAEWLAATDPGPWRIALTSQYNLAPGPRATLSQLLRLLFMVVGVVLLIATANIAVLLLARATVRRREIGIRAALGAGRARVIRQLLTESALLAFVGGIGGLLIAFVAARFAAGLLPYAFSTDLRPHGAVIVFTLVIAALAAGLFGLIPALQLSRLDVMAFLQRGASRGGRSTVRHVLVVAQLALSIVLVTGAGLFARSLRKAQNVDLGFDPGGKLLMSLQLESHGYDEVRGAAFVQTMEERLAALPGVTGVTLTRQTPFRGMWTSTVRVPGTKYAEQGFDAGFNAVGPDYFKTMGILLVAGREFDRNDRVGNQPVLVVNEVVASDLWPDENAVGRTITRNGRSWTVIGVARNAQYYQIGEEPTGQIYLPLYQVGGARITFVLHTARDPVALARDAEDAFHAVDPNVALYNVLSLDQVIAERVARYRVMAVLVTLFGSLALLLAAVGLYGVQSYLVSQRTREIGVRLALGANERRVAGSVIGHGFMLTLGGIAIGITGAFLTATLVQSMLFGIHARDPLTFISVPVILLMITMLASLVPAWRASRVDPMVALREE
jgi:putative ABC transport system permease protein